MCCSGYLPSRQKSNNSPFFNSIYPDTLSGLLSGFSHCVNSEFESRHFVVEERDAASRFVSPPLRTICPGKCPENCIQAPHASGHFVRRNVRKQTGVRRRGVVHYVILYSVEAPAPKVRVSFFPIILLGLPESAPCRARHFVARSVAIAN